MLSRFQLFALLVLCSLLMVIPPAPAAADPWAGEWATYVDDGGNWQIDYPVDLLTPERLNEDVVIFIGQDRSTVLAVDSYVELARNYGNTGENMRNRSMQTLAVIYGRPVSMVDIPYRPAPPWRTGVDFATDLGSKGEARYWQPDLDQIGPTYRAYGVLFGFKAHNEVELLPVMLAIRESFSPLP